MVKDDKIKVEGVERIKLRVKDEVQSSAAASSRQETGSNQSVNAEINFKALDKHFSPIIGGNQEQDKKVQSDQNQNNIAHDKLNQNLVNYFIQASPKPTQKGPMGILYDFNFGIRVYVPKPVKGEGWRVCLMDLDCQVTLLDQKCFDQGFATTSKHHYMTGKVVIYKIDKMGKEEEVFAHKYNAEGKEVLISFPVGSLGDSLGWMPYAEKFREKHKCKLTLALGKQLIDLFKNEYPEINFVDSVAMVQDKKTFDYYASYYIGLFFHDDTNSWQPRDFRLVGLHRTAGYILGVDPTEVPPRLSASEDTRPIPEPYVVIATHASTQCKYWNNPFGWYFVIDFLKGLGYRVICIDKDRVYGRNLVWNHIPNGVEDQTGPRPLTERVRWLKHAEFFVGLSSGLAWLAWGAGIPVVIISGFTDPLTEFDTPYRVFNTHVCNGCWNDIRYLFDHKNFLYCPKHENTPRQFECTRAISHQHVIQTILSIPGCRQKPINEKTVEKEENNESEAKQETEGGPKKARIQPINEVV